MSDIGIKSPELFHPDNRVYNITEHGMQELRQSHIPNDYYKDKSSLETAVKYYAQWENVYEAFTNPSDKNIYSKICNNIIELLTKEKTSYKKVTVTRDKIYEAVNEKIKQYGELYSWIIYAMGEWNELSEKIDIKNPTMYLKACIRDWICGSELEEKNQPANANYSGGYKNKRVSKRISTSNNMHNSTDYLSQSEQQKMEEQIEFLKNQMEKMQKG